MPIATVFQSNDGFYTEVELRREDECALIAAYDLFGQIKLYRIEWFEYLPLYHRHQVEHRLDLAVRCFNTHVEETRSTIAQALERGNAHELEQLSHTAPKGFLRFQALEKLRQIEQAGEQRGINTYFYCGIHTDTTVECRQDDYYCPKCGGVPPSVTDYDTLYPHAW